MASNNVHQSQGTVVIIDDSTSNAELCQICLEIERFQVHIAKNNQQGLKMVRQLMPDVILLDIMMPDTDGFQVLEKLKADTIIGDIPVLVHSVRNETPTVVKALEMGADDFLKKPFDVDELIARVRKLVIFKRSRDALLNACHSLIIRQQAIDEELKKWAHETEKLRKQFEKRIIDILAGPEIDFKLKEAMAHAKQAKNLINRIVDLSVLNLPEFDPQNN